MAMNVVRVLEFTVGMVVVIEDAVIAVYVPVIHQIALLSEKGLSPGVMVTTLTCPIRAFGSRRIG